MKYIAALVGIGIAAFGTVGVIAPDVIVRAAEHALSPSAMYLIALARVLIGVILIAARRTSRTPKTFVVLGVIAVLNGLATPFVGIDRVRVVVEWWAAQTPFVMATGALSVGLGTFISYAAMGRATFRAA